MQSPVRHRDEGTASLQIDGTREACPACGEPVMGIAAAGPGDHRFVGCDHRATDRLLRASAVGTPRPPASAAGRNRP